MQLTEKKEKPCQRGLYGVRGNNCIPPVVLYKGTCIREEYENDGSTFSMTEWGT
jgi:hypothetical protein